MNDILSWEPTREEMSLTHEMEEKRNTQRPEMDQCIMKQKHIDCKTVLVKL